MKKSLGLFLVSSLLLTACHRSGPQDPMQQFTDQKVNWEQCDYSVLGYNAQKRFDAMGERLKCAEIKVPLDWKNPARGTATMALIKAAATKPAEKQGTLFFNPGGPGADGLSFAPNYGFAWDTAEQDNAVGRGLKKLSEQFDLVGFSPRGTGNSSRLYCGVNELVAPLYNVAGDRSQANIDKMIRQGKLAAKACDKNPLTPYINTDQTVRDMDLARQLLGDKKMNYIGYSYGTWLGSWYAKRFPENAGRIMLDGNMPWSQSTQTNWESDAKAFTRSYKDIALPYITRHDDIFHLGTNKDKLYQRTLELGEPLRTAVSNNLFGLLYGHDQVFDIGMTLKVAVTLDDFIKANPEISNAELMTLLEDKPIFPDMESPFEEGMTLNDWALSIADDLLSSRDYYRDAKPKPVSLMQEDATLNAVICNDTPWNKDLNYWRKLDDQNAKDYPLFGGKLISEACVHWNNAVTVDRPVVTAKTKPLLMVQNEYDPATPREGAFAALDSIPNSRMVFIDNEHMHTAFPYGTDCVDLPVIRYFLTGELPKEKITKCQAVALPLEDKVYPAGETYVQGASLSEQSVQGNVFSGDALQAIEDNRLIIHSSKR